MSSPSELLSEVQRLLHFGIAEIELPAYVVTWSDELFRIYGWEPGSVTPSRETLLQRVHPADVDRVDRELARATRIPTTQPIEFRIVLPGGQLRTLEVRSRLVCDAAGAPVRMIGTTHDITDHKETAARLVFADRMASVGTLAGGVAHEINNPLAFISAHLELIAPELGASPVEIAAMLSETRAGVDRIKNIVRGLQAFSSTDEDQRSPLDVQRVLELALVMTDNQIRHRARLVRAFAPMPDVVANPATLAQVFLNLLVNAAEAIPEEETQGHTITVSTRSDDAGWAIIEIRDTGRGIARDIQNQIFDPFFTTKPVGKGTGLGLSMCHGIVRSLGGEVGFTTSPGAGTVFRVALPPAIAAVRANERPPAPPPAIAKDVPKRLLIVEDEVVFANALRRLLQRDKHAITIVHEGKEALARAEAGERFDVIVCDLMMPAMSGMELHAKLSVVAPDQAARVIFLTGGAFSPMAKQFLDRMPNAWFEKPCDLDQLRAAIRRVSTS
ncbi:MAG: response regulator [Deltaproteobacteria bacterium]|nr:response regulator [Deltaproteobacteria bacterium]